VGTDNIPRREIVVQDASGTSRVVLWREHASTKFSVGDNIRMTAMVTKSYISL
jgi:hypothetical protein